MIPPDQPDEAESPSIAEVLGLSPEPICLFDAEARLRAGNPALSELLRPLAPFLATGTPWNVFLLEASRTRALPEDVCQRLRLIEERLDRPGAPPEVVSRLGESDYFRIALRPLSDGGFALSFRESEDPDAIPEESEVEQITAKVLEACPTCLTMARIGDGRILYRSPSATELLGKGFHSRDHFARREERADFITALLPNARVDDMRITARRPDGSTFPASISARLIDYRGEEVMVSSILDLSDELALQDALARQKEQVFQSEKMSALGELLAGVAHELNNPLSIVVGNAHMLLEEAEAGPLSGRLAKLIEAAERCVRIVRTFLSMARERPLEIDRVPAETLIGMAVDAFQAGENGTRMGIDVDLEDGLPELLVDEVQILQVLTNLLINAGQAMLESGQGTGVEIVVRVGDLPGTVRIRVTDEGPGVPAEIAGRIFDPLFTTKSSGKGTGVGLALCHRIVTAHGGTISLDTSAGVGASFVLVLPAMQPGTVRD